MSDRNIIEWSYMTADRVVVESDECGFELHVETDEGDLFIFNIQGIAEEVYDAVKGHIGPWLQEMHDAKREFDSGIADDPTQQAILDRIKHGEGDGPWPGEPVMDYYQRTGQDGPLREVADAMNKTRRENP